MRIYKSRSFYLAALALACTAARADWVVPHGGSANLGQGTASLGCVNVQSSGTLSLDGGALVAARDVVVESGAQLQIGRGQVELAQQWINNGSAMATSGGVVRVASPGCPVVGQAGPVSLQPLTPPIPQPVQLPPGGPIGIVQVAIGSAVGGGVSSLPPGCTVTRLDIDRVIPSGAPSNASFPLGVMRFEASGCPGAVLRINITYPPGSLAGLTLQKYGPHGTPRQTGWFTPPGLSVAGDTVSYTVADGGEGDNDATAGRVADPFAPMKLAAPPGPGPGPGPGGAQAIPTLSEWALLLLSTLVALLGARRLRRRPTR